jgi:hypothetical protein
VRLALDDLASNARGPFPEVATDALHKRIFNLSIFRRHGPDAIVASRYTVGSGPTICTGRCLIKNSPATNIMAAKVTTSIAVISSSISFKRKSPEFRNKNAATRIRFRAG